MKAKKGSSRGAWRFSVIYAICLLFLFVGTSVYLLGVLRQSSNEQSTSDPETIYVYLPQESPNDATEENETPPEDLSEGYLVKEYRGQIGIFQADGTLLDVLETYVKTLPEADRDLLGEGISVNTRAELSSIIEDYSH